MSTLPAPLPFISATFRSKSIAIPRKMDYYDVNGLLASLRRAFPALSGTPGEEITVNAQLPGMTNTVQIIPELWQDIWNSVLEVAVKIPPTDAERRLALVTGGTTTKVSVKVPAGQYHEFRINLHCATAHDLKLMLQEKIGVPVERQILLYGRLVDIEEYTMDEIREGIDDEELYPAVVPEDDVLIGRAGSRNDYNYTSYLMKLRPRGSTSSEVASRSSRF
ncbi:hypothetical protein PENSPDRAFT_691022 [Peniophora sp. CONT]|nr:hypothetical protein PENSPDRAFT_691022 [Peniophora sp. CONT]